MVNDLRKASSVTFVTAKRRYQLLCRIARSLDAIGDRWALLILRDLHAGPARFGELEHGLGVATNLLSTRLGELTENGLVSKESIDGQDHYVLTELGRSTDRILWELARFGVGLEPGEDLREPGNLRTLVLPLRFTFAGLTERTQLGTRFVVDGETVSIRTSPETATVDYGDTFTDDRPADLEVHTDYDALLAVGEGRLEPTDFLRDHVRVVSGADRAAEFLGMLASGIESYGD